MRHLNAQSLKFASTGIAAVIAFSATTLAYGVECPTIESGDLTLRKAVTRAVCLSPNIDRYAANVRQSQANVNEVQSGRAPAWSTQLNSSVGLQRNAGSNNQNLQASATIEVNYKLRDGGLQVARERQAAKDLRNIELQRDSGSQDAILDFIDVWTNLRDAEAVAKSRSTVLASARSIEAAAQARYESGNATRVDVITAQASTVQAQRDFLNAQSNVRKARGVLGQYLNLREPERIVLAGDDLDMLSNSQLPSVGTMELLAELMITQHPRLLAQRANVQAALEAVEVVRAGGKPQLSLAANAGPTWNRSNAAGGFQSSTLWNAQVGVNWSYKFSDGGSRDASVAKAMAVAEAAQASYEEAERSLLINLRQRYAEWSDADANIIASRAALQAAAESEAAQSGRYRAGLGTVNDVIAAQSQVAQASLALTNAEHQRLRSRAALLHSVGQLNLLVSHQSP